MIFRPAVLAGLFTGKITLEIWIQLWYTVQNCGLDGRASMNYATIKNCDIANGPGVRVSLFVSGCTHRCPGCFNEV